MLTVACVYWKGKFRKREELYDASWVKKLKNMVERNLNIPHRFVCLTNTKVPCESIKLIHDWPGYWSKVELFRPGLFEDRVLYLDLDVLILKDLVDLVNTPDPFTILKANGARRRKEGKLLLGEHNSSVMTWDAKEMTYIYEDFIKSHPSMIMSRYMGDQEWITTCVANPSTFPEAWVKKLKDCYKYVPTEEMKIALCMLGKKMYGKNKTALKAIPWVKEVWK